MKNRRQRRLHQDYLRNPILWMGLILASFFVLLLWDDVGNIIENFQSENAAPQEPLHVEDVNTPIFKMHHLIQEQMDGESSRRVYPYSVVNGGVHSVQELRSAIGRDPVVAKHYSNFKLDRARLIEANADRYFHVSYRMGDEIFWTKKRLKVAKSEKLITDGTTSTRTRCANVLSEVLSGKTSPDEPTAEVLNTPTGPPPEATPFIPPAVVGGGSQDPSAPTPQVSGTPALPPSGSPPFIPPVVIGGGALSPGGRNSLPGPGPEPGPGPVPVPEPTTLLLFVSGLLGLAGYGMRKFLKK